ARDAADVETGAAERGPLIDDSHRLAQLRRTDGRHVAAGSAANDDQIESLSHHTLGEDVRLAAGRKPARLYEPRLNGHVLDYTSSSSRSGSSMPSLTRTRKLTAPRPSMRRWSYDSARYIIGRITPSSLTATGRFWMACMPRMAACGGLRMGVDIIDPKM